MTALRKEEWRKKAADIPPYKVETVCVQPDKYCNIGETAERQGGSGRVCYDAILS